MTLGEFLNVCDSNQSIVLFYYIAVPLTALLSLVFGRGEGHLSPWKNLYMILLYLAAIPGIFAVFLNIYLFLFEKQSILSANIYTQILPIFAMLLTLWIIRRNVSFDAIPGFDKIGGLLTILTLLIGALWILEKTHIFVISFMPFHYFILFFIVLLVGIRFGLKRVFS